MIWPIAMPNGSTGRPGFKVFSWPHLIDFRVPYKASLRASTSTPLICADNHPEAGESRKRSRLLAKTTLCSGQHVAELSGRRVPSQKYIVFFPLNRITNKVNIAAVKALGAGAPGDVTTPGYLDAPFDCKYGPSVAALDSTAGSSCAQTSQKPHGSQGTWRKSFVQPRSGAC